MSKQAKPAKDTPVQEIPLEELEIGSALYVTKLTNKFNNRKSWKRPDDRKLHAIIPGTIQKVMVKEGDQVKQGTPLMILEAMKMRNEVLSPVEGVIRKIHVSVGNMVPKDYLLVEFK
jgi:biotin carboxyl carrier protein